MRKMLFILVGVFMLSGLFAYSPPPPPAYDLVIPNSYDFSDEQINDVFDSYWTTYETWLDTPGFFSKGQTGLMILDLFALRDTLAGAAEFQAMLMLRQFGEIGNLVLYFGESLDFITNDVNDQYDLIDNLYAFMTEGKADSIVMLKDSLIEHLQDTYEMTMNNIDNSIWNIALMGDSLDMRFDSVIDLDEDFMFRVGEASIMYDTLGTPYYDTSEVAVIYDETYETILGAKNYLEDALYCLGNGLGHVLHSDSSMAVGLDTLAMSMAHFQNVLDTLNNYSMWSFLDSSDLADIETGFAEAEALINGKTYFLYRREDETLIDSIEIRPIGIVENIHYGLYRTYIDMYSQADPHLYTFREIFPSGLPDDIIDQLAADIVIDPRVTREDINAHMAFMMSQYSAQLIAQPENIDAHTGLGYIQLFSMMLDAEQQINTIADLAEGGRIDSLFQNYDWTNIDYSDEIASIRNHLFKQVDEFYLQDSVVVFTILIKDPRASSPGYSIAEGDLVYPVYVIPQITEGVLMTTFMVENAINAIGSGLEYVYTVVDSMIDITLDPNLLDLSDIEEPLDLIYALEASNPNFGAFTPEGKVAFAAFGDSLARGMQGMADLADTVIATVNYAGPLLGEFGMTPGQHDTVLFVLDSVNHYLDMFAADLADPAIYTYMPDDTLNLSAWFDEVPDNLLQVCKNYFEGTDPSMGGFFPTRAIVTPGINDHLLPLEFALKGNYPNPFNPMTTIGFDLPDDGMVTMDVFNITGRKMQTLLNQDMKAGTHELTWNATDHASGVYIVRVQYNQKVKYQKMTLLK